MATFFVYRRPHMRARQGLNIICTFIEADTPTAAKRLFNADNPLNQYDERDYYKPHVEQVRIGRTLYL